MNKLTKKQLQDEIVILSNNAKVYEALGGDASEAKIKLELYLTQLNVINDTEHRLLKITGKKSVSPPLEVHE
jgi:hypothetical protein